MRCTERTEPKVLFLLMNLIDLCLQKTANTTLWNFSGLASTIPITLLMAHPYSLLHLDLPEALCCNSRGIFLI